MSLTHNDVINEYRNTGSTRYAITFEYDHVSQVKVRTYDTTTNEYTYVNDWEFDGATAIRFTDVVPDSFQIIRETDISQSFGTAKYSTFVQGGAIRASDLNGDFELLRQSIEEGHDTADDQQDQIDSINDEIDSIQDNIDEIESNIDQIESNIDDIEDDIIALDGKYVNISGDTMTGQLGMSNKKITSLGSPEDSTDAVNKQYVDGILAGSGGNISSLPVVRYIVTAGGGETVLNPLAPIAPGNEIVTVNGSTLTPTDDYTVTTDKITLKQPLLAGDEVMVLSYNSLKVVEVSANFDTFPYTRWVATAYEDNQTLFSGGDPRLAYSPGFESVFLNGSLLTRDIDYIANDSSSITLIQGAYEDDVIDVHSCNYIQTGVPESLSGLSYTYPGGVEQTVQQRLEQHVSVKDFGAKGDGVTNDAAAIQAANNAATAAGLPLVFPGGVYGSIGELSMTTDWYGYGCTILRLDWNNTVGTYTISIRNQKDLILSGITVDNQVTAVGQPKNSDIPEANLPDVAPSAVNNEDNWYKNYGVLIQSCDNIRVKGCTVLNVLRAGFRCDYNTNEPLNDERISNDIYFESCTVRRSRGVYGDCFLTMAVQNVHFSDCLAEDFTRIGFVTEFALPYGSWNSSYVNCTAKNGHDWGGNEHNTGFWAEVADNVSYTNCSVLDCPEGFALSAFALEGPKDYIQAAFELTGCFTDKVETAVACGASEINLSSSIVGCNFNAVSRFNNPYRVSANRLQTNRTRYQAGGLYLKADFSSGPLDFSTQITNTNFNIIGGTITEERVKGITANIGGLTNLLNQSFDLFLTNVNFNWDSTTVAQTTFAAGNNQDLGGDIIVRGLQASPASPASINLRLENCNNHTNGTYMYIGGVFGNNSKFRATNTNFTFLGDLTYLMNSFNCTGCEVYPKVGYAEYVNLNECIINGNPDQATPLIGATLRGQITNCDFKRGLSVFAKNAALTNTNRLPIWTIRSNQFLMDYDVEPGIQTNLSSNSASYYTQFIDNTFLQKSAGVASGSTAIKTTKSSDFVLGEGNVFDSRIVNVLDRNGQLYTDPKSITSATPQDTALIWGTQLYIGS